MKKIKIFITYKDKHRILKSDIITPIQTGRAIANEIFDNMLGDDTGDNISIDNPKYNELSAQYWVWKHYEEIGNPEYVGFMHYRRHFVFDQKICLDNLTPWFPNMNIYMVNAFSDKCLNNLSDKNIYDTISDNADCYAIKPYDISYFEPDKLRTIKEHYLETIDGSIETVWNEFDNAIRKLYPHYIDVFEEFNNESKMNCCNMFIMKKDVFFDYCEFCFNVLSEVAKNVNSTKFNAQEMRFCGFLGEYLLSIFIRILKNKNAKINFWDALLIISNQKINSKNYSFLQKIFSISNIPRKKLIYFFGLKIKLKTKNDDSIKILTNIIKNQLLQLKILQKNKE